MRRWESRNDWASSVSAPAANSRPVCPVAPAHRATQTTSRTASASETSVKKLVNPGGDLSARRQDSTLIVIRTRRPGSRGSIRARGRCVLAGGHLTFRLPWPGPIPSPGTPLSRRRGHLGAGGRLAGRAIGSRYRAGEEDSPPRGYWPSRPLWPLTANPRRAGRIATTRNGRPRNQGRMDIRPNRPGSRLSLLPAWARASAWRVAPAGTRVSIRGPDCGATGIAPGTGLPPDTRRRS